MAVQQGEVDSAQWSYLRTLYIMVTQFLRDTMMDFESELFDVMDCNVYAFTRKNTQNWAKIEPNTKKYPK